MSTQEPTGRLAVQVWWVFRGVGILLHSSRSLVVSFVHSRLDYGNFILVGLPAYLQRRLRVKSSQVRRLWTLQLVWCFDFVAIGPRHRYPRDIILATSPGTGEFQTCADGISCAAWHGAGLFQSARLRLRSSFYTRAVRSVIPSDNHWPSLVSCCSRNRLEHIACPHPVITNHHLAQPLSSGWRHSCFNIHFPTSSSDITNYVIVDFEIPVDLIDLIDRSNKRFLTWLE